MTGIASTDDPFDPQSVIFAPWCSRGASTISAVQPGMDLRRHCQHDNPYEYTLCLPESYVISHLQRPSRPPHSSFMAAYPISFDPNDPKLVMLGLRSASISDLRAIDPHLTASNGCHVSIRHGDSSSAIVWSAPSLPTSGLYEASAGLDPTHAQTTSNGAAVATQVNTIYFLQEKYPK